MALLRAAGVAGVCFEPLESRSLMSGAPIVIEGVQPIAFDQPRINALLRRTPTGDPLAVDDGTGSTSFTIQAFYDTGASGVLVSLETAQALGVQTEPNVQFEDVGVGGSQFFDVSEPVYISLAKYPEDDTDNYDTFETVYNQKFGPIRMQVAQTPADDTLLEPLDVFGMPVFAGKVVVLDPKPLNTLSDYMHTYVYDPGTPFNAADAETDPGIPSVPLHVKLSYASLDRFTRTTPAGAPGPTLAHNPFIGPNPLIPLDPSLPADSTPGITVGQGSLSNSGSWLLDTGAQSSILSEHMANSVGVFYKEGTFGTDNPVLVDAAGHELPNQYTAEIGGIGGSQTLAGFYLDSMTIPTVEGQPIEFSGAPVLVGNITTEDPNNGQQLTLDGVFGMNYLVASASLGDLGGGLPGGDAVSAGPFDWAVVDEVNGLLGLQVADFANAPPPVVAGVWASGSTWTDTFRQSLADRGLGSATEGYDLTTIGAGRLPWTNVDQISIAFSEDVDVDESDLAITGGPGKIYAVKSFNYDQPSHVATWTLTAPVGADVVSLKLDGTSDTAVASSLGKPLDGDNDGTAGGDAAFTLSSLPGDADHSGTAVVSASDLVTVRNAVGATPASASYKPFADLNGDGSVNAADLVQARNRVGTRQPAAATLQAAPSSLRATWRPTFSETRVLTPIADDANGALLDSRHGVVN